MPTRVLLLSGSIPAGAAWTEIARTMVPAGETWTVQEVRILTTHDDIGVRIVHRHGASIITYVSTTGRVSNSYRLPLPVSFVAPTGSVIAIEATNPTTSAHSVFVEIVFSFE